MKYTKDYYETLYIPNGWNWYHFEQGLHCFKRLEWFTCNKHMDDVCLCTDEDIEDGNLLLMIANGTTRYRN